MASRVTDFTVTLLGATTVLLLLLLMVINKVTFGDKIVLHNEVSDFIAAKLPIVGH